MELPVHLLIGLGNTLDAADNVQRGQQIHIPPAGVSDETQNGVLGAFADVDVQIHAAQPSDELLTLCGGGSVLQNCDHKIIS